MQKNKYRNSKKSSWNNNVLALVNSLDIYYYLLKRRVIRKFTYILFLKK